MTDVAFWTHVAIGVLIAVPPVIFALFLKDALALLRNLGREDELPASGGGADGGG